MKLLLRQVIDVVFPVRLLLGDRVVLLFNEPDDLVVLHQAVFIVTDQKLVAALRHRHTLNSEDLEDLLNRVEDLYTFLSDERVVWNGLLYASDGPDNFSWGGRRGGRIYEQNINDVINPRSDVVFYEVSVERKETTDQPANI